MTENLELRQYIISKKKLNPKLRPSDITNDIRAIRKYKKIPYNTIYQLVYRTIKRGTAEYRPRHRTRPKRTQHNINHINQLLDRSNERSCRSISKSLKKKKNSMSKQQFIMH
jgi:hypothetical protein